MRAAFPERQMLLDWFIVNVVKLSRHAEQLRLAWQDGDDLVGCGGWKLTTERVVKSAEGLDLKALLDQIERDWLLSADLSRGHWLWRAPGAENECDEKHLAEPVASMNNAEGDGHTVEDHGA